MNCLHLDLVIDGNFEGAFQFVALMKNWLLSGLLRKLAMTIRVAVIARHEAIQIQAPQPGLLPASCLAVRNDGDLYRHHSFLQGIFPMPATNDKQKETDFWVISKKTENYII